MFFFVQKCAAVRLVSASKSAHPIWQLFFPSQILPTSSSLSTPLLTNIMFAKCTTYVNYGTENKNALNNKT